MADMLYGTIPGVRKPISRLVQGTVMINSAQKAQSFQLLDAIFALGCNTFDTAHVYGSGDNERTVGQWVRERGLRDQLVIIGKGAHHNEDRQRVTPFDITADIHDSLARFGFDHIDLYLLHRDDPTVPVGPIVEVLNEHQAAGRIHAFGGSNWSHERVQQANEYAHKHNLTPLIASSPNFSLAEQVKEPWDNCISIGGDSGRAARQWYQNSGLAVFAWSSLAGGFFSDRFTRTNLDTFTEYLDRLCVESYCYERNFQRLDRVRDLAAQQGLTIPQVAMAYVMSQPMNIFALVGCRNADEFRANIEAIHLRLTPTQMAWLELEAETM
jgi:aryl-alcohol dehydrogenase-like predicted oxidoreductase